MRSAGTRALFCGAACLAAVCTFVSCGGGGGGSRTPTQPAPGTPVIPTPPSTAGALRGVVVDMASGAPVEGATIAFTLSGSVSTATTSAAGTWEFSQSGSAQGSIPIEVSAPGFVTRATYLRWAVGTRTDIVIDLIRESEPFSLAYYRQLVRNLFSAPESAPEPLRRWTRAPNFYINTHNPHTGGDILQSELDVLIATIQAAVPQLTGGRFGAGTIESGSGKRAPRFGFIALNFVDEPDSGFCGRAFVGSDPGEIMINYAYCPTPCGAFAQRTVAHEVGHAMGFFHVAQGSVLNTDWQARDCGVTTFSAAEQHHARVAYARVPGNLDPDNDPASSPLLNGSAAPPVRISCR